MRLEIKKLFKGYDPADLMEQAMYCFGSDGDGGDDGSEDTSDSYGGNMGLSDAEVSDASNASSNTADGKGQTNVSNVGSTSNVSYSPQFSADVAQSQGLDPSVTMNAVDFGMTTQGQAVADAQNASMNQSLANTMSLANNPVGITSIAPTNAIDPYGINQTVAQNTAQNIGLANMANFGLSPEAMASIGTTGYSPDSVTGFGLQNVGKDVSDITTADQMTTMSNTINNPLSNMLTTLGLPTTQNQINMGYTPSYTNGQITGTMDYGIGMGMPSNDFNMSGSGLAVSNYAPFNATQPQVDYGNYGDIGGNESDPIVSATRNPVSGQPICPDGYRFDDDLQACRLDTTRTNRPNNPNPYPTGDQYYRATSLDNAPVNTPSGFDFNSANNKFINQFAYRPSNYQNQMGLNGFTPFRSS